MSETLKEDARIRRAKHAKHAKFVLSVEFDEPSPREEEISNTRVCEPKVSNLNTGDGEVACTKTSEQEQNNLSTSDTARLMRVARHARTSTPKHARKSSKLVVEFDDVENKKESTKYGNKKYENIEKRAAHAKHAATEKKQATSYMKHARHESTEKFNDNYSSKTSKGAHEVSKISKGMHESANKPSKTNKTNKTKTNNIRKTIKADATRTDAIKTTAKNPTFRTFARVVVCAFVICAILFVATSNIPAINPAAQEEFTVTFDAQGGTSAHFAGAATTQAQAHKNGTYGAALFSDNNVHNALPTSEKTGYTFLGWFTQADGGEQVSANTTISNAQDHTLYAHWKRNSLYM